MPRKPPARKTASPLHRQARRRAYDRKRDRQEWRKWYKTYRWQQRRAIQLATHPLCANCLKHGRTTLATVADHVIPHRGDHDLFWQGELQSLCDQTPWRCHSSVKQKEERLL